MNVVETVLKACEALSESIAERRKYRGALQCLQICCDVSLSLWNPAWTSVLFRGVWLRAGRGLMNQVQVKANTIPVLKNAKACDTLAVPTSPSKLKEF